MARECSYGRSGRIFGSGSELDCFGERGVGGLDMVIPE